ncbi:MAG: DUF4339 domain-containing protein [Pirellulales bacterium]
MALDKRPRCPWCTNQIDRFCPDPGQTSCRKLCPRCKTELEWSFSAAGHSEPRLCDNGAASPKDAGWYYRLNGLLEGPVSDGVLVSLARTGTLGPNTPVRRGRDGVWHTVKEVT